MLKPAVKMTSKALFGPRTGDPGGWADGAEAFWCLGWIFFRSPLGECYFHVGVEEGFENFAVFFPEQRAGLVVFSSGPSPAGVARDAVESVFGTTGIPFAWTGYQRPKESCHENAFRPGQRLGDYLAGGCANHREPQSESRRRMKALFRTLMTLGTAILTLAGEGLSHSPSKEASRPLNVLVLLDEWFGRAMCRYSRKTFQAASPGLPIFVPTAPGQKSVFAQNRIQIRSAEK
jgi:hypothetical protein